jgi:hypothetical protein
LKLLSTLLADYGGCSGQKPSATNAQGKGLVCHGTQGAKVDKCPAGYTCQNVGTSGFFGICCDAKTEGMGKANYSNFKLFFIICLCLLKNHIFCRNVRTKLWAQLRERQAAPSAPGHGEQFSSHFPRQTMQRSILPGGPRLRPTGNLCPLLSQMMPNGQKKKIIKPNPYFKFFLNFLSLSNSIVHFMMNLKSTKRQNLESKINFELEGKDEKMRWIEERGGEFG